jgi:hypothetical protein
MLTILGWLPYSMGVAAAIIVPAIIIAKQEIAIEGPFGWSALTFTRRFTTKSLISKIYRFYSGNDKWATEYHLMSNTIWLFIYVVSFLYVAYYSKLIGIFDLKAWVEIIVLAVVSFIGLNLTEDYIWFLIHPYFGPDRLSSEYIPWHQSFRSGIPASYWGGLLTTILIAGVSAILLNEVSILLIWLTAMALVIIFCVGVRDGSNKAVKLPLAKYWWRDIKYVAISRCPWVIESEEPYLQVEAYVISTTTMRELMANGKVTPLGKALAGKK